MKLCPKCEQAVAQDVSTCPACGAEVGAGRTHIDDYRILEVLHEGHATLLCRCVHEPTGEEVMIRLFTRRSGVDEEIAHRLRRELEQLKELPADLFVQHQAVRRSSEGLWYRVSEWVNAENWGALLASGQLRDPRTRLDLFVQTASALALLHHKGHIIPHLILNDIMVVRGADGELRAKIDYKLSRFFNPRMDRPGPMLAQLLERHPDIVNRRPLDARSDIWSLGKVFVELLAGDLDIPDHEAAVDDLTIPDRLKVVLRVMLADDPDLRPQSTDELVDALSELRDLPAASAPAPSSSAAPRHARSIRRRQRRFRWLVAGVVVIALLGVLATYLGRQREDAGAALEGYANRYAQSVAFVVVDYRLSVGGETEYRNVAEGTAFLVDEEGYLLTSRHVVCPWIENQQLLQTANRLLESGVVPKLEYEVYLWFEGQKAFNPAARILEQTDVADYFVTKNAYSIDHPQRRLRIDARGKVIGIAAALAVEQTGGLFPTTPPLVDIGLILPITGAANLLTETKAGGVKWNGVLDFTLESTLARIKRVAVEGRWAEARSIAEEELGANVQAGLLTAAGMLAFGVGDFPAAKTRFSQLHSMDPDDGGAKLMLYLIDWLGGVGDHSPYRSEMVAADWRSPLEFAGYLVRMLEGSTPVDIGVEAWHNPAERSWLRFVAGLMQVSAGDVSRAETSLRQAVLSGDNDNWAFLLALARLEQLYRDQRESLETESDWAAHQARVEEFRKSLDDRVAATVEREKRIAQLRTKLASGDSDGNDWLKALDEMRELQRDNLDITATLAFGHAANEHWSEALEQTRAFLSRPGRPTSARMSLGLIAAGLLRCMGQHEDAEAALDDYERAVPDDWYLSLAETLAGRIDAESFLARAEQRPEEMLVANAILGFWAECSDDEQRALGHYRTALGPFLVDWLEYGFARTRIQLLKQADRSEVHPTDR